MRNVRLTPRALKSAFVGSRRILLLGLLLSVTAAAGFAAVTASASGTVIQSAVATSDQLLEHGIELKPLPPTAETAVVSVDLARATARKTIDAARDPDETFRVLASAKYYDPKQTAWLFLFKGGSGPISAGPVEGAESRAFTTDFTGVLIDDQTGEVLRWFQGGHFAP